MECKPADGQGWTIWLEPPWHCFTAMAILAGSQQAAGDGDDGPTEAELDLVSQPICEALINKAIEGIEIDKSSHELTVTVEGGRGIKTFVVDPRDDHVWHIRENPSRHHIKASAVGLFLGS